MKDINAVCTEFRNRISSPESEIKQQILRELIDEIVFDGNSARIRGALSPLVEGGNSVAGAGKPETQLPHLQFELSIPVTRDRPGRQKKKV